MQKRTNRSRNLILEAADTAFRELGFAGVSMEEIAQRAGLTRKTVYNLFASKEEIASRLAARVEAQYDPTYRARIAANEAALGMLEDALLDSARWCLANPSIASLALAGPTGTPSLNPPSDRPSLHGLISDLLVLGQRQGVIRKDEDPDIMSKLLLGAYAQTILYALSGGPFQERGIKYLLRLIVEGIGVQNRGTGKAPPQRKKTSKPKK